MSVWRAVVGASDQLKRNNGAFAPAGVDPALLSLLDCVRFFLALIVVVGHLTQSFFQDVFPDLTSVAVNAVGGFFLISGFTIRMLYPSGRGLSLRRYMVERWSRILSVVLPALLVGSLLDAASRLADPAFFASNGGEHSDHEFWRIAANMTGLSQIWGHDISPGSNSPLWSLSYELAFYTVFGLWITGRRILAGLVLLAYGPNIAVMLPFWLLGVLVYDVFCARRTSDGDRGFLITAGAVIVGVALLWIARSYGEVAISMFFETIRVSSRRVTRGLMQGAILSFVLLTVTILMLRMLPGLRHLAFGAKIFRWLGNFSFPLYAFHLPLLVLFAALGYYDRSSTIHIAGLFACLLLIVALLTPLTDRLKRLLRTMLDRLWGLTLSIVHRLAVQPGA